MLALKSAAALANNTAFMKHWLTVHEKMPYLNNLWMYYIRKSLAWKWKFRFYSISWVLHNSACQMCHPYFIFICYLNHSIFGMFTLSKVRGISPCKCTDVLKWKCQSLVIILYSLYVTCIKWTSIKWSLSKAPEIVCLNKYYCYIKLTCMKRSQSPFQRS